MRQVKSIFILNDQAVMMKKPGQGEVSFTVESGNLVLMLNDGKGTFGFKKRNVTPDATLRHDSIVSIAPRLSVPTQPLEWEAIAGQNMAVTDGGMVFKELSVMLIASIYCAKDDISICASHISFLGAFLTSTAGKIILKAPDDCPGWLRSLTFERAPGERPFDMMFQGAVSFHPRSIEDLLVVGTNKVILSIVTS